MHGSAMTHITQPMMKLVRLPVPHEPRQRQIAAALSSEWRLIDGLVDRLSRQIELLREHRQALITAAVTGQLNAASVAA
jgi:type I restriction enzyme S subunit